MCQALLSTEDIRISKTKTNPCPPKAYSLGGRATGINHISVCVCRECSSGEVRVAGPAENRDLTSSGQTSVKE